jgi:hypothetical protein
VVEHPGLFLRQDDDPAGTVGKSFEHRWLPALPHHRYSVIVGTGADTCVPAIHCNGRLAWLPTLRSLMPSHTPGYIRAVIKATQKNGKTVPGRAGDQFATSESRTSPGLGAGPTLLYRRGVGRLVRSRRGMRR